MVLQLNEPLRSTLLLMDGHGILRKDLALHSCKLCNGMLGMLRKIVLCTDLAPGLR